MLDQWFRKAISLFLAMAPLKHLLVLHECSFTSQNLMWISIDKLDLLVS